MSSVHFEQADNIAKALQSVLPDDHDFSAAAVAMYASDASNYRQLPLGVIHPRTTDDLITAVQLCKHHQHSVLMRGGGTSQNGQCVNNAVVIDCSRYLNRVLSIDVESRSALIEPGVICDSLKAEAEKHGLTFGPDPATHSRCTLGGMIGNNSCGPHSMLAGKTVENVLELNILTSDGTSCWVGQTSEDELERIISEGGTKGEIYRQLKSLRDQYADEIRARYPSIKRRVSGFNLDQLLPENNFNIARALVGTEGTCVTVLQARVKLIENPKHVQLVVLGFNDIFLAGDTVPAILTHKPIAMEGIDWNIVGGLIDRNLREKEIALLPTGRAWILIELAANTESDLEQKTSRFVEAMHKCETVKSVLPVSSVNETKALWSIREQGASATSLALHPDVPDPIVGWEDTAVDPMQLGDYLRSLYALVERYGYSTSLYGHFGDGCIHARMTFDTRSESGVEKWRQFSIDIANLVVQFGGSLSGEHGDGQAKAEFLPIMFGDELVAAFAKFKAIWDSDYLMNPGKVVQPYKMHENLRYGPDYTTPVVNARLQFTDDIGGFGRASERCIGMGKCRATSGAMCPSYQATNNERYSTRGRARLLHELARGEVFENGWKDEAIADSLEHCLSCKACKSSCPTQVDIASYKAEFLYQHYKLGARRSLHQQLFGRLGQWLPYLSKIAPLVNWLQKSRIGVVGRRMLDIDETASLPTLASRNFDQWATKNATGADDNFRWFGNPEMPFVVLWADSVNTFYSPNVLISAIRVLTGQGYKVGVANQHFCCGRPLYDAGFLDKAEQAMSGILTNLYPFLKDAQAIVVMEPSCLSTFKDEIKKLFPNDERAARLSELTLSVAQLLQSLRIKPTKQLDRGLLHLHCHDKAIHTDIAEREWMAMCFKSLKEPEEGCCGMAGTFGLKTQTREIAQLLLHRTLAPAISNETPEHVVVSNGFSCRHQLTDVTRNRVLHPVEVIEQCL